MYRQLIMTVCLISTAASAFAIEEPSFDIIKRHGEMEVRRYEPFHVAAITVDTDFGSAGNRGFMPLFRYIDGANGNQQKISMTAPVIQEQQVDGWAITFTMPESLAGNALPSPTDPRVVLREVPAQSVAVIRYSGSWGKRLYDKQEAKLRQAMADAGLQACGEARFARYNPPFTPWFWRRNEIHVPVCS